MCKKTLVAIFLLCSFLQNTCADAGEVVVPRLQVDYHKDVAKRKEVLRKLADGTPAFLEDLEFVLDRGGILALRDLLIVLGDLKPESVFFIAQMPLTNGIFQVQEISVGTESIKVPIPSLKNILDIKVLVRRAGLEENKKYTYYEIVQALERTIRFWDRDKNVHLRNLIYRAEDPFFIETTKP